MSWSKLIVDIGFITSDISDSANASSAFPKDDSDVRNPIPVSGDPVSDPVHASTGFSDPK